MLKSFLNKLRKRFKYLQAELKEANDELQEVRTELKALNNKRSSAFILKEKDTFIKYRQYQGDLVQIENKSSHTNKN
jgi:uncharacterized protein YydD (DUF2326 family)